MSGPSVVVDWAPDGWTHIGGPGMHLLIGLDEDDEQTLVASDAADGGDLDDVIEVLTSGGMRKARHFIGVHWQPSTRLVAFGPVAATVTLADGSEHEVRATSSRVWTDVELAEHPAHVRLRVLDETEAKEPSSPAHPVEWALSPARAVEWALSTDRASDPLTDEAEMTVKPADSAAPVASVGPVVPAPPVAPVAPVAPVPPVPPVAPVVPTFGGSAATGSTTTSPWQRSWAQHSPSAATTAGAAAPPAPAPEPPTPEPVAPQSNSSAMIASPTPEPEAQPELEPDAMPVEVDVESTLSGRLLPESVAQREDIDIVDGSGGSGGGDGVPPSYDYLFGHTTTVDEHRRVLAELERPAEDDQDDEQSDRSTVAATARSAEVSSPVGEGDSVGAAPPSTVAADPAPAEGVLISSVPWARPAATDRPGAGGSPADPETAPEVPTFAGRHTPPPAPTLLPPAIVPPPGTRTPAAAPIITTGPPPPAEPISTPSPADPPLGTPEPTPVAAQLDPSGAPPTAADDRATADGVSDADEAELTVDRSALIQAREAARSQVSTGPSVLAVLCSSGHPTPPHGDRCRVCGSGIPPQEPFAMPRPPLGVLRLSTGDVVTLDRSVLLGRAPRLAEGHSASDRPHVVKVPSPERDVSRNHVEVVLEGWHVLIRDLGTTNGTTVALPGEVPVRLRANDQQVLEAGSLVSMADEVSFVFEAAP